jgi:peroxisomal coenzyme A diphosphatase NUDT7
VRLAAVLVLLYEQAGELRVLLTTRSKLLRAHPGQTALPGGKVEENDVDFVETAVLVLFRLC